jgi:hypothetical protein
VKYHEAKTLLIQVACDQFNGDCAANKIYTAPGIKGVLTRNAVVTALQRMEDEGILEAGAPGRPRRVKDVYRPALAEEPDVEEEAEAEERPAPVLPIRSPTPHYPIVYVIQEEVDGESNTVLIGNTQTGKNYLVAGISRSIAVAFAQWRGIASFAIEPHPLDEVVKVAERQQLETYVIHARLDRAWQASLAKFASQRGVA